MRHTVSRSMHWMTALMPIVACHTPTPLRAQREPAAIACVKSTTAAQVTAELALYQAEPPSPVAPGDIAVAELTQHGGYQVVRATVTTLFDWPAYSLLIADSGCTPVGGFAANARALSPAGEATGDVEQLSGLLIDAFEAQFEAAAGSTALTAIGPDTIGAGFRAMLPPHWPLSGIATLSDDTRLVRATVLRRRVPAVAFDFTPVAYAFLFARDGHVLAVALRIGPPLATRRAR